MQINNNYNASYIGSVNKGKNLAGNNEKSFSDVAAVKAAEADRNNEIHKKASAVLDSIGSQAPDEVKQAWMEAEKETGAFFTVGGLYITADGKHAHITQMGVERLIRWYWGQFNQDDLLGNSVESAINAVNKWIYDVDHPLAGSPAKSWEEQQLVMKEREFYEVFLNKLLHISKREI